MRDQEAPPPRKGAPITLDDDDSDVVPTGGRKKGRPDGRRQVNLEVKRRAEQERLTSKIEEMMNTKQKNSTRLITNSQGVGREETT